LNRLQIELQEWLRQKVKGHRYEDIDGDEDSFSSKPSLHGQFFCRKQNMPFLKKEVDRGKERTRVLSISFIFSFSPLYR
jgi:hypothetical protein